MHRSPFRWPDPIDASTPYGGLFYGDSRGPDGQRGSRQNALETLDTWLSEVETGAPVQTLRVPCLYGPYLVGKTSVIRHCINQKRQATNGMTVQPALVLIGSHDEPLKYEAIRRFAKEYVQEQIVNKLPPPGADTLIANLFPLSGQPFGVSEDQLLRQINDFLTVAGLPALRHLVRLYHTTNREFGMRCFVNWVRNQECPAVIVFHTTRIGEDMYSLLFQNRITFLEERWREKPQWAHSAGDNPNGHQTNEFKRSIGSKYGFNVHPIEIPALNVEETLSCIHGLHPRVRAGQVEPPYFCLKREKPTGQNARCPRATSDSPRPCSEARQLIEQTGTHPGFIQMLCHAWNTKREQDKTIKFEDWLDNWKAYAGLDFWEPVEQWWKTLPRDVQMKTQELLDNGTTSHNRRLARFGVVFRMSPRGKWIVPKLIQEWWHQKAIRSQAPNQPAVMLDKPANDDALDKLKEALNTGQTLAFVGAGCSFPLYPLWRQFVNRLIDRCILRQPDRENYWNRLRNISDLLDVADECKVCLKKEYLDILQQTFDRKAPPFLEEHRTLMHLPFRHFLTSNYDPCLEEAFTDVHKEGADWFSHTDARRVPRFPSEINASTPAIFHVHGRYNEPEYCVFTEEDYQTLYSHQDFRQTCLSLFQVNPVVFVGFSLNDADFMGILRYLKAIFKGASIRHFAILPYPSEPVFRREQLRTRYNIEAIFYPVRGDDHSARQSLLQSLIPPSGTGAPPSLPSPVP